MASPALSIQYSCTKDDGLHDDDRCNGNDGMMVWGLLRMLLALLVLFLFILAATYGVKWVWGQNTIGSDESAFDILKKRYARGEISKEEFERIKKEIE